MNANKTDNVMYVVAIKNTSENDSRCWEYACDNLECVNWSSYVEDANSFFTAESAEKWFLKTKKIFYLFLCFMMNTTKILFVLRELLSENLFVNLKKSEFLRRCKYE